MEKNTIRGLPDYSEETILKALKDIADKEGKKTLTKNDINQSGIISAKKVWDVFGSLSNALERAGLTPGKTLKYTEEELIENLLRKWKELGRQPYTKEMKGTRFSRSQYKEHFGSWREACEAVQPFISTGVPGKADNEETSLLPRISSNVSKRRRRYGELIDFRGLRHAPINELGVVFLFGMLCQELGIIVESIQSGFPDCEAKLKIQDGTFESLRIEFEYKSNSFVKHGHNPEECDMIVCWEHDWVQAPNSIEIIELKGIYEEMRVKKDQKQ